METPSLPLAIEGFLVVLLSGLGTFFIARLIARLDRNCGQLASLGFLLITLGGAFHASGKLIFALTELYSPVLYHTRWALVMPGFVLLAWAIWKTFHSGPSGTPVWVVPVIIIVIGGGAAAISALSKGGERWFYILLGLLLSAATATSFLLAWQAWHRGWTWLAALFFFHVVTIFLQAGLVRLPQQTVRLQWLEQFDHTLSWAAFAYAAWQLEQRVVKKRNEA
jgi:hypothetical protein